tara:strand:+ start:7782 stop:9437 length:1656 start_codon:yes stop_codon:yes gene_type:complete
MQKANSIAPRLFIFPAVTFIAYIAITLYLLSSGHLHEDAYILYIYAESLAQGNGIAYFPGGAPAEGATDFLWMVMLAGAHYLGLDVAIAAGLLNGLGLGVIVLLAGHLLAPALGRHWFYFGSAIIFLVALFSQIAQASLAGFSTALYCAFVAATFYLLYARRLLPLVPVLGITLGLLRPDGVLIGVTATLIGLYGAWRQGVLKAYLVTALISGAVGLAYFYGRYVYFGHLLPLPLYVKSTSISTLPGLAPHLNWLWANRLLVLLALAGLALNHQRRRMLIATLPVVVLLIAFMFATQSQNAAFRFQAPGTTILLLWAALLPLAIARLARRAPRARRVAQGSVAAVALMFVGSQAHSTGGIIRALQGNQYIYYFSYYLDEYLTADTTIALTEAGRFAYWAKGEKYDLVGLNTPETAIHKPSPAYLERLDPDLIFTHTAAMANYGDVCQEDVCELTPAQALAGARQDTRWQEVDYGVQRAPLAVLKHLEHHPDEYRIFAVRYYARHEHLYLVKKSGRINLDDFTRTLRYSFTPEAIRSYLEMKQAPGFTGVFE